MGPDGAARRGAERRARAPGRCCPARRDSRGCMAQSALRPARRAASLDNFAGLGSTLGPEHPPCFRKGRSHEMEVTYLNWQTLVNSAKERLDSGKCVGEGAREDADAPVALARPPEC